MENEYRLKDRYHFTASEDKLLGRGASGSVYLGKDLQTNEDIAIKKIEITDVDETLMVALKKEIEISKMIECKYSTKFLDFIEEEEYVYIIMEKCDGDLNEYFKKLRRPFEVDEVRNILTQLNYVFYIMNKKKIIHRDLKLANIFIKYTNPPYNTEFDVKLGDYGFSTISQNDMATTALGTPITMAPEIIKNEPYTNKVDIWSLGVIMYMMLFNEFPFYANTYNQLLKAQLRGPKYEYHDKECSELLKKMLTVNPADRISWQDYFNHSFFKGVDFSNGKNEDNANENNNAEFISVYESVRQVMLQSIIRAKKKYEFNYISQMHSLNNKHYACFKVKDTNTDKNYIIKRYSNAFIKANKALYEQEKELFEKMKTNSISSLNYIDEQDENDGNTVLIFEDVKGTVLSEYIKQQPLEESQMHFFINSFIKDIFLPLYNAGVNLRLITIDSIFINYNTNKGMLFDCGLQEKLYQKEQLQIKEYFIYNDEFGEVNEKTNVLNFGITLFKAFFNCNPVSSIQSKEIMLPHNSNCSDKFKKLLGLMLYRNKDKRATWKMLNENEYLTSPFKFNYQDNSLFTIDTIDYISKSFKHKYFITDQYLRAISDDDFNEYKEQICFFILSVVMDLSSCLKLFNYLISPNKQTTNNKINMHMFHVIPESNNNLTMKCIDFTKVPIEQCACEKETLNKIKIILPECIELRRKLFHLFYLVSLQVGKGYEKMNLDELIKKMLDQLNRSLLFIYIENLFFGNPLKGKEGDYYLKYIVEFMVGLYGCFVKKVVPMKNAFYEVNRLFNGNKNNMIEISTIMRKKEDQEFKDMEQSTSFICMMKGWLKNSEEINSVLTNRDSMKENNKSSLDFYVSCLPK